LRCVRTESAPVPETRLVSFDMIAAELPPGSVKFSPSEREAAIDIRRRAVSRRFAR
jgi:hypothetical protein